MSRMCRKVGASLALAVSALFLFAAAASRIAVAQETPMPDPPAGASVRFLEPADGAKVKSPVHVRFEAVGIKTEPAGPVVAGSGHHHVIIDEKPPGKGKIVGADATHLHFGKAQTEAMIELEPGKHQLNLQFADGVHRSYGPKLTTAITIEVVP